MSKNLKFQNYSSSRKFPDSYVYKRSSKKINHSNSEIFYTLSPSEKYKDEPQKNTPIAIVIFQLILNY